MESNDGKSAAPVAIDPAEDTEKHQQATDDIVQGSSWLATYFNLTNTAIGAGTLVRPFRIR